MLPAWPGKVVIVPHCSVPRQVTSDPCALPHGALPHYRASAEHALGGGPVGDEDPMLMFVMQRHRTNKPFTIKCSKETCTVTRQGCSLCNVDHCGASCHHKSAHHEGLNDNGQIGFVLEDTAVRVSLVPGYSHVRVDFNMTALSLPCFCGDNTNQIFQHLIYR